MEYRRLGRAGIKVSALSLGSWVTFGDQVEGDTAVEIMRHAYEQGVNFFDNAEVYAHGRSEELMGSALKKLRWPRYSYVVSTKFFWGIHDGVNTTNTLNRKYLLEAIDDSLERLGLAWVDIAYCHRPDPETTVEETVWAMHDIVSRGKAHYWGVSEWPSTAIREAFAIAERHHLHKPVTEQPQYNLLHRAKVESEFADLYAEFGLGLTTWSPLASGLLTGKYRQGVPAGSRASKAGYEWVAAGAQEGAKAAVVEHLVRLASGLGCTPAQLAIAFCLNNPQVSTVITGASSLEQLKENLGALEVAKRANPHIFQELGELSRTVAE